MQFYFENDIAEFKGIPLIQRYKYRKLARVVDPSLRKLDYMRLVLTALLTGLPLLVMVFYFHFKSPWIFVIAIMLGAIVNAIFNVLFVNFRVCKALEIYKAKKS